MPGTQEPSWNEGLTKQDYTYMQQLGTLTVSGLIMEVKKLHDLAYQLGLEEAKEMTRGKYLNIFASKRQRQILNFKRSKCSPSIKMFFFLFLKFADITKAMYNLTFQSKISNFK